MIYYILKGLNSCHGGERSMEKKQISILIVIIAIIFIGSIYVYATNINSNNNAQNTTINETHMKEHTESTDTHKKANQTVKINITAEQAKQIAKQYIETPGAYPGTPALFYAKASGSFKGGYIWEVPIMLNVKWIDGIQIDAQTGENLGEG